MTVKITRVRKSDLDDILEISKQIWEGHDYLPSAINTWLRNPASYTCGVKVNDRLVAVANLRLIENGRTGWMEGLRVHPDYRGRGFANALTKHVIKKGKDLHVQCLRYTTSTRNQASLKLAQKFGFAQILEMGVFWHPDPKNIQIPRKTPHITKATAEQVHAFLQENPKIIPHNILIYDWKAVDCTLANLKMLEKSHELYVIVKNTKMHSFSCGTSRRRGEQTLWVFTIYARDPESFLTHLSHNISLAYKRNYIAIMGTYPTRLERTLQSIDWLPKDRWGTRLTLLEKPLPSN